jgi:hypothetical protein
MRKKPSPELLRRMAEHEEFSRKAHEYMQQVIDETDAMLAARRERDRPQPERE